MPSKTSTDAQKSMAGILQDEEKKKEKKGNNGVERWPLRVAPIELEKRGQSLEDSNKVYR